MWVIPAFISAALLGLYDVSKKHSLNGNAVIPVLFLNVLFCCILFVPLIILSYNTDTLQGTIFQAPPVKWSDQPYLIAKAIIVLSSWITAYFAIKHLPITLTSPIKATQPLVTLVTAMIIFGERLNGWQWCGVLLGLSSIYLLSVSGKKDGINFKSNKWVWLMILSVLTGSASGLYDKYLIQYAEIDKITTQVWYNFYQLIIMGIMLLFLWYPKRKQSTPFHWSWSIPLISIFLTAADFVYFYALSEGGMISIVSLIRRSSVIVSFTAGAILFKEKNLKTKIIDLLLILLGMVLIYFGTE
ncbi:MAG: EamA family transporter [Marinifilaceae bacterium]|nr:EamA family transporter [Marinifilaceae bacterium]